MPLHLSRVPGEYAVHRLAPDATVPGQAWQSPFVSVSRSPDELSIITDARIRFEAQRTEAPWCAYRVPDAMDFNVVGVMAALTAPLAHAGIALLAVATFDTDYVLVHGDCGEAAEIAWRSAGIEIV
ncbi:MAG: ACT domain-containing protein [Candidatus Nanopelagicales bacterium]|jgi:hypothetical protein